MFRFLRRIRQRWWLFRHDVYYYEVPVPPSVRATGGDDSAMIQNALDEASRTPEWFADILAAYQRKWYKLLLKKPVLKTSARFQSGIYVLGSPIVIGDNMCIGGQLNTVSTATIEKSARQSGVYYD